MTTAYGAGHDLETVVRPAPRAPRVLTVRHGHRPLHLWHRRLVLGALLGGAMAGALLGVAWALRAGLELPLDALRAYGIGAAAGAAAGLALGAVLSAALGLTERYVLPQRVAARRRWVRYRR